MTSEPLAVAVVSPQPVVRHGLVDLLRRHPDQVSVVPLAAAEAEQPDVVLYDVLDLLDHDARELEALVKRRGVRVLAVSRDLRPELVARALAAGVHGYFSIGVSETELVEAVLRAARGEDTSAATARLGGEVGLTERETEVLTLIAQGFTNHEIAQALFLSPNSIKTYVRTAYRKIGAGSRSQAVSWAIRHGFPTDRSL